MAMTSESVNRSSAAAIKMIAIRPSLFTGFSMFRTNPRVAAAKPRASTNNPEMTAAGRKAIPRGNGGKGYPGGAAAALM
jgi:hypothetical protein